MTELEFDYHKEQFAESLDRICNSRVSWLRHLLLLCATLLGLLASLYSTSSECLFVRWASALSCVLLALGILSGSISLYGYSVRTPIDSHNHYIERVSQALLSGGSVGGFSTVSSPIYGVCETIFYIFASLALLCLVTRTVPMIV
jgi:hypothetical protein